MNFGWLLLSLFFMGPLSLATEGENQNDTELSGVHPTPQKTSLFLAVEQFMDFFAKSPQTALDQNEIQEIPLSSDFASFEVTRSKISAECPTALEIGKITQSLQETKYLETFWREPLFLYHGRPVTDLQEKKFTEPTHIVDLVFYPLSHASLPPTKNSPIDLRFQNVLRKMNIDELTALAKKAEQSRTEMIALEKRGCVFLKNSALAQQLLLQTSAVSDQILALQKDARAEESLHPHLPYAMLNKADRRVLSLYLGAYLWRYRGYGGYSELGTASRRSLFVAVGFAQIARLNGAKKNELLFADLLKWGVQWTSWGQYHDLGRLNGTEAEDLAKMEELGRGLVFGAKNALRFQGDQEILLSLAGQQMGRCYDKGWNSVPNGLTVGTLLAKPLAPILMAPSNYGELCTGAGLGLAIAQIFQNRIDSP